MNILDSMSTNEVIELYYAKHAALNAGDMVKLLDLKRLYPDLFTKTADTIIRDMINYVKAFQKTDRYKELKRKELKDKLTVIVNPDE